MRKFEKWTIAYRRRTGDDTLLDNQETPFIIIPNTWRYWAGDPHLINVDGVVYIFAELYDRVLRRGVIGYCTIDEHGASQWKVVLKMPHHLSYPHLIERDGTIYMIPESYVANEIAVYKAISFPNQWEKVKVLKADYCSVDSTLFSWKDTHYLLTLCFAHDEEKLMLYTIEDDGVSEDGYCAARSDANKRPAGHFFTLSDALIRPAQDCSDGYGCALNFYKVTDVSVDSYEEELVAKIRPCDLHSNLRKPAEGVHTYNFNDQYEVIDLKEYEMDPLFYIMRPIWFSRRRIKRIFKY